MFPFLRSRASDVRPTPSACNRIRNRPITNASCLLYYTARANLSNIFYGGDCVFGSVNIKRGEGSRNQNKKLKFVHEKRLLFDGLSHIIKKCSRAVRRCDVFRSYATVAQSVEQLIRNQQVAGSSPASSSIKWEQTFVCSHFCCVVVLEPSAPADLLEGVPEK